MRKTIRMRLMVGLVALIALPAFNSNDHLQAQNKLRVYIFAGQSNCNGAGGRVARYRLNASDYLSPFVYKMLRNVNVFDPDIPENWKSSGRTVGGDVGVYFTHMRYPFHTLYKPENIRRKVANLQGLYDEAADIIGFESRDQHLRPQVPIDGFDGLIGAEVQFARKARATYPDSDIAIIKVSAGASTMDDWEPAQVQLRIVCYSTNT